MSALFKLNTRDFLKGTLMAVLAGFALPILMAMQAPGFNILDVNWGPMIALAINGAVVGFATYVGNRFFSDSEGKLFGKI